MHSPPEPVVFTSFAKFGGHTITAPYLALHLCAEFQRRKRMLTERIMMIRGDVLAGDMSFKVMSATMFDT